MGTRFEESLQRDIDLIRNKVMEMSALAERALRTSLQAFVERNLQLAYAVILRDQYVDDLEKQVDRLCLEFLVRQQPVAGPLRFVYSVIKINLELERIGDYAESIARQVLRISSLDQPSPARFVEIANLSIPMLHDAVRAFVDQDAELARRTVEVEERTDAARREIDAELVQLRQEGKLPLEALTPLMTIARRFERVADQAKNICEETLYMCTGEYVKHKGTEVLRILFVDEANSCRSQMAEAIGNSLRKAQFVFTSAGLTPESIDPRTVAFLAEKGMDISRHAPKSVRQIPNLDHYHVIVALAKAAQKAFPPPPSKTVGLDWNVSDPSKRQGSLDEVRAAYEETFQYIHTHVRDLVQALLGENTKEGK